MTLSWCEVTRSRAVVVLDTPGISAGFRVVRPLGTYAALQDVGHVSILHPNIFAEG